MRDEGGGLRSNAGVQQCVQMRACGVPLPVSRLRALDTLISG